MDFLPARMIFEDKPPEAPGGGEKMPGELQDVAEFLKQFTGLVEIFAREIDPATFEEIKNEFARLNESNKDEVYRRIHDKFDAKLSGKVEPKVLDEFYAKLKQKIDAEVKLPDATAPAGVTQYPKSREELEALQEQIEQDGEAKDYAEAFNYKNKSLFHAQAMQETATVIEFGKMNAPGQESPFDYELWLRDAATSQELANRVADYFESPQIPFPRGAKGRAKFIEGLRKGPPRDLADQSQDAKDFRYSYNALQQIVAYLKDYKTHQQESKTDLASLEKKHPLGDTIGDMARMYMTNLKRSKGLDKGLLIGATALALYLLWGMRDQPIPGTKGKMKWSTLFFGIAGFAAVNHLSGKVSKTGQTLTQRLLDVQPNVDDLKKENNPVRAFAVKHGMVENQEKLRVLPALFEQDIRELFPYYKAQKLDQSVAPSKKQIDPALFGLHNNEVDGHHIYEVMDDLVQDTAVNVGREHARASGNPDQADKIARWTETSYSLDAFEKKYIDPNSTFGQVGQTLFQVISNEYPPDVAAEINKGNQQARLGPRTAAKLKGYKDDVVKRYKDMKDEKGRMFHEQGIQLAKDVGEGIGKGAKYAYKEGLVPLGTEISYLWTRYAGKPGKELLEERQADSERDTILKVLPPNFAVQVTKPGQATIMGYPGLQVAVEHTSGGKEYVEIDGKKFDVADGTGGRNKNLADELGKSINESVEAIVKAAAVKQPGMAKKKIEWDGATWKVLGVEVHGNKTLKLGNAAKDVTFTIELAKDGKSRTPHFAIDSVDVGSAEKLDTVYRDAEIKNAIAKIEMLNGTTWVPDPNGKYLAQLPITNIHVAAAKKDSNKNKVHNGVLITGKIAGLPFEAVLTYNDGFSATGHDAIQFMDSAGGYGGTKKLEIPNDDTGRHFVRELSKTLKKDPNFKDPFNALNAQIQYTDEGLASRLEALAQSKTLKYIPSNVAGALNGKILGRRWEATLEFKAQESQLMFEHEILNAGNAGAINDAYQNYIIDNKNALDAISADISSMTDEQRADDFETLLGRVENINYQNKDYQQLFQEYKTVILDKQLNYDGLEGLDAGVKIGPLQWGASDKAYEIYETLLLIWSHGTRELSTNEIDPATGKPKPMPTADQNDIRKFIRNVERKLILAQKKGGGVIKKVHLPNISEDDIETWIKS